MNANWVHEVGGMGEPDLRSRADDITIDFHKLFDNLFVSKKINVIEPPNADVVDSPEDAKALKINNDFMEAEKEDSEKNPEDLMMPQADLPADHEAVKKREAKKFIEVDAPPEFVGAPYEDEVMMGYRLGNKLPGLMKRLDPSNDSADRAQASFEISVLYSDAIKNDDRWSEPLNKRKKITIEVPADPHTDEVKKPNLDEQPEFQGFNDNPPFDNVLDQDPDEAPEIDESELLDKNPLDQTDDDGVEEPQPEEKKKNWFQRKIQEWKDFDKYAKRNRKEADILALVGSGAGISSALIGAGAAELALSLALPGIVAGPVGVAAGLAINYLVFSKWMRKWSENKMSDQLVDTLKLDPSEAKTKIEQNIKLDHKMRIKAFATADLFMKIVTGIGLGSLFHYVGPSSPDHQLPVPQDGIHGPIPDNTVDHPLNIHDGPHGPVPDSTINHPGSPSESFVAPEPTAASVPEIPHNLVDYVVKASDNSWEQVLHQNGMETMGPDSIKALSMNRDNIIQMFEKWATTHGGNGTVPIEMGPDSVMQEVSVKDVAQMLDEAIRNGYPTEALAKHDYAEYARQLANYQRVTKWVLPGTHLQFPAK